MYAETHVRETFGRPLEALVKDTEITSFAFEEKNLYGKEIEDCLVTYEVIEIAKEKFLLLAITGKRDNVLEARKKLNLQPGYTKVKDLCGQCDKGGLVRYRRIYKRFQEHKEEMKSMGRRGKKLIRS